tara:strand:- start:1152 stop:1370 length:219 start_codon:yes stop_codon:yes gene_type:complete
MPSKLGAENGQLPSAFLAQEIDVEFADLDWSERREDLRVEIVSLPGLLFDNELDGSNLLQVLDAFAVDGLVE